MLSLVAVLFTLFAPVLAPLATRPTPGPAAASATVAPSRLEEVHFQSKALAHRERYRVYLPPGYDASGVSYPVVVLLHGLGGEGIDWFDPELGDLRRIADGLVASGRIQPFVAVAPDGRDGYWTDHVSHATGTRYGSFIGEVLVDARERYRLRADAAAIVGASMGGHGSMSYGLMHPGDFRAIVSMSGALFAEPPTHRPIYKRVWGNPADRDWFARTAPMVLLRDWPAGERLPALWIHCGEDDKDRFLDWSLAAHALLEQKKIPHGFLVSPGGHGWTTWRNVAPTWLTWLDPYLR